MNGVPLNKYIRIKLQMNSLISYSSNVSNYFMLKFQNIILHSFNNNIVFFIYSDACEHLLDPDSISPSIQTHIAFIHLMYRTQFISSKSSFCINILFSSSDVSEHDIYWILTVPAQWEHNHKVFMGTCAVKVIICVTYIL